MNIISFDIEEWYLEKKYHGARIDKYKEFDVYLDRILDILEQEKTQATFFCLGKMASEFPYVVRKIADKGHEVGCHSNKHMWLTKMTPKELMYDTKDALMALEDVVGKRIVSYRAPAFSITSHNKWAFEVLADCGIERDSSIFPAQRDFGGFESFGSDEPIIVEFNGTRIEEFPICTTKIMGKTIAYTGGGYFRFFPYWYIRQQMRERDYVISYFHIADLLHKEGGLMSREEYENYFKEPGTFFNRFKRYVKSSLGTKKAFDKMCNLIKSCNYTSLDNVDNDTDWSTAKKIIL